MRNRIQKDRVGNFTPIYKASCKRGIELSVKGNENEQRGIRAATTNNNGSPHE